MIDKTKFSKITRCILFLFVFIITFWFCNRIFILKRWDGLTNMQNLYAQKRNTVDVLVCGSSLGGELGMDELWYDYGIAGYNLWGSSQPFWNCYFYLVEALKTQKPKVVVLEVAAASYQYEYQDDERQMVNTQGMRFCKNFLDAIRVSAPKERYLELLFGLRTFHSRFKELSKNDFLHFNRIEDCVTDKGGFHFYHASAKMDMTDFSNVIEVKGIHPKEEKYLRLFIELCQQKNISVLLIKSPSVKSRVAGLPYYNYISKIADEYGINFIDTNKLYDEIGFEVDDAADVSHINIRGMWKLTSYIGSVLRNEYGISDRREEKKYSSYEKYTEKCHQKHIEGLKGKKGYEAEVLRSNQKPYVDLNVPIYFGSNNYNAPVYVRCGLSEHDKDFSWTDGKFMRMICNFPKSCVGKNLKATYHLAQIFNEKQKVIVYVNNRRIFDKELSNSEDLEFYFTLPTDTITAHIMIEFPNAVSPKTLGFAEDNKELALAIKNVVFSE